DAIAEEYVEGRELYVSVMGHRRLTVFPPRELVFRNVPEGEPRIATYKAKWDDNYRERWGIDSIVAKNIAPEVISHIEDECKRAYRALDGRSYLRFDIRLTAQNEVYIIEPNANPCIAYIDELSSAAKQAGMSYEELIQSVVEQAVATNEQAR